MLSKLHILPIVLFILIPSSFLITYAIAVYLKHVEVDFPYISDTGTHAPESCIFSFILNLVSFFLVCLMYVRYKHVEQHSRDHLASEFSTVYRLNWISVIIGWIGCFGVCVLANFQETNVVIVHFIGAGVALGCATAYSFIHSIISYSLYPLLNSLLMARLRLFLSVVMASSFFTTVAAGVVAFQNYHGKDSTKWYPQDGGYTAHVISTAAEWLLVITFDFFVLSFTKEMQSISMSSPKIHFIIESTNLPNNDFYGIDEQNTIATSQSSLRSYPQHSFTESSKDNIHTTQAIVH